MSRRVEEVEAVFFARLRSVSHGNRVRFNRDSAFPFQIHGIEELILFFAFVDRAGALEQSIRQGGFAVIDMRDDAEIARMLNTHEARQLCGRSESSTRVALVFWEERGDSAVLGSAGCQPAAASRLPATFGKLLRLAG